MQCLDQELEQGAILSCAGGHGGPDSFAPTAAPLATRPLRDLAVDDDEPHRPLGGVVRGLDIGALKKLEVFVAMLVKPPGDRLRFGAVRWTANGFQKSITALRKPSRSGGRTGPSSMPGAKQGPLR